MCVCVCVLKTILFLPTLTLYIHKYIHTHVTIDVYMLCFDVLQTLMTVSRTRVRIAARV